MEGRERGKGKGRQKGREGEGEKEGEGYIEERKERGWEGEEDGK